jgi:predicted ATPase
VATGASSDAVRDEMRLTKIEFNGYKRLAKTSCNVDTRLVAIVGPNESGKSSVLEGLAWLTAGDGQPLPPHLVSRSRDDVGAGVVRAHYMLELDDLDQLAGIDMEEFPRSFHMSRTVGGVVQIGMAPEVRRSQKIFGEGNTAMDRVESRLTTQLGRTTEEDGPGDWFDHVRGLLQDTETAWDADDRENVQSLSGWLQASPASELEDTDEDSPATDDTGLQHIPSDSPRDAEAAEVLDAVLAQMVAPHPSGLVRECLFQRTPGFWSFEEQDRVLESQYNMADDGLRSQPPRALANLLSIADLDLDELWAVINTGDITRLHTKLRQANNRLEDRLRPTWRQADLTVHLNINGTMLQVLIDELDEDGATTAIAERSDGLKIFVALVCFLIARGPTIPPIVLIDEAETHLHYDAQADLLDVLLNGVEASKVIYTTHSPGCLPPDLGTGVRLLAPDRTRRDVSNLKNDFWNSNEPGFSPLLFAMGAGAAAFSVCRRAVLAEGPSDMILLPSMLRAANDITDLPYQVAPGLSTVNTSDFNVSTDIAAKMAYLVDGDDGGRAHAKTLIESGVAKNHIVALPDGQAIEDLLTAAAYLTAVNKLMADGGYKGSPVRHEDLDTDMPISVALDRWCASAGSTRAPGKTAVASHLVQDPQRIELTPEGRKTLRSLHTKFSKILGTTTKPKGDTHVS